MIQHPHETEANAHKERESGQTPARCLGLVPCRRKWVLGLIGLGVALCVIAVGVVAIERLTRTERSERAAAAHTEELYRDPASLVVGNPDGDVSIVAFHDYNCPDCRAGAPELVRLTDEDGQVKLILKDLPVLGRDSEDVARIVLAAERQGGAQELHRRLETIQGRASKFRALKIAEELGLDRSRLERDMNDPEISAVLAANKQLAGELGIRGVPFYLVGDQVWSAPPTEFYSSLQEQVARVRSEGCGTGC